jgi:hypothetical protein
VSGLIASTRSEEARTAGGHVSVVCNSATCLMFDVFLCALASAFMFLVGAVFIITILQMFQGMHNSIHLCNASHSIARLHYLSV